MSWITILWSMTAAACLTLAAIHFLVWGQRRTAWADLLFTLTSVGVAVYAGCELEIMLAQTPAHFAAALRWLQVPTWVVVVSLAFFVRLHLQAGRRWLAWSIFAFRSLALLLNFIVGQNLNYREVTGLRHIPFLGETVALGIGVSNPLMLVGQLSLLLLVIFTADATVTVWRRGDRRQALLTGGSIVFFSLTGMLQAVLVLWRLVDMPLTESFFFLGIVLAMGYEMSRETLRAAQLSDDLRESEERMTLAGAAAGFGVWMWNIPRNQVWASKRWRSIIGFAPEAELTFDEITKRIHHEDRGLVQQEVQRAIKDQQDFATEYRIVLPDGTQRWVMARGKVFADSKGKPMRMLGATIEITQRKEGESALKESNQKFRLVVEASPSGILLADEDGRMTLVNEQMTKLFGYAREELIGQSVDLLVPERFQTEHGAHRNRFHHAPSARMMGQGRELFGRRKDGTEFPLEIGLSHIPGPKGILVLAAVVDLTARKKAETEALLQRNELARVARVSTMGELASSLAHELNQPLGAIMRNAEAGELFLQDPSPDLEEVRAILADIRKDDERAGAVIDRMRNLIKRREIERCPVDMKQLTSEVLGLVRADAEIRRVRLTLEAGPPLPPIQGDRVQLQQVMVNLLLNAMDATKDNPPTNRVVVARTRLVGATVEVTVTDNGHGISAENLPRLFEPFFTSKPKGLGMGLSISRSIVEMHGGKLWAENNPDGGATFHFTLPAVKEERGSNQ